MKTKHEKIMRRYLLLVLSLFSFYGLWGQVGVNTENPQGVFHIDPRSDTNGNSFITDDIVVDSDGKVGIGTNTPTNKLEIAVSGADTGLKLPNGASSGKVLTSDTQGNAVWVSGAVQYQTMVSGTGGTVNYTFPNTGDISNTRQTKVTFFNNVNFDKAKEVYGSAFGWDVTNQWYVAPVTGIYRIAVNAYFNSVLTGQNSRLYVFRNDAVLMNPGFASITDAARDLSNYFMGLVSLNAGDRIDFRVSGENYQGFATTTVRLYGSGGHTFILIESL